MRKFSVCPVLTPRGRTFKGLRGWSGKPLHPPRTDIPVTAYLLAAVFDVTVLVLADIVWRLADYHTEPVTPAGVAVLSAVTAGLVSIGATFDGSLVFEYGFNVETAGDSPVWHKSEDDVFPGQRA
jgi:uncharacterized membrane protein